MHSKSIVWVVLGSLLLVVLGACDQRDPESSSTTGGQVKTPESAGPTTATSTGLTYTAVLTYRNVPDRGESEDIEIVICNDLPLTTEAEGRPNDIYYSIKYYETMKAWTGSVENGLGGPMDGAKLMQDVMMTITLSDGSEYIWKPHDGDLRYGSGEGINIHAPELMGK